MYHMKDSRIGRRRLLQSGALGGAGLLAAALIGCDDDDDDDDDQAATPTATADGSASATSTPAAGSPTAEGTPAPADDPDYVTDALNDGAPFPYNFPEPDTAPKSGGTLVVGGSWSIATWDTNKSTSGATVTIPNVAYNRLIGMVNGPAMSKYSVELQPELAREWEVSPDGLSYTFHLQSDVKFQNVEPINGRPFVANDVVLAYQRAREDGVNRASFSLVSDITAPDDATVEIALSAPDPDFLIPLANRQLPIYPMELVDQELIDTTAIGTGPGIITEVQPDQAVKITSNPDYWAGKPLLDGMEFRLMPDAAAKVAAFRAGQLDFADASIITKLEADALLDSYPEAVMIVDPLLAGTRSYAFNLQDPRFADERIRRAMSLAINRDEAAQVLFQGYAKTPTTAAWPFVFDKFPTDEQMGEWRQYDPDKAQDLLSAAGAEDLTFECIYQGNPAFASKNELFSAMFRDVGITMNLQGLDNTAFNAAWIGRTVEEAADGYATVVPSANGFYYAQVHSESPNNRWYIDDPQLDQWAEDQRSELDPDARREIWEKEWQWLQDKVYRIEHVESFRYTYYQPWLRYFRWNGSYVSIHSFYEWGLLYPNAWLDK